MTDECLVSWQSGYMAEQGVTAVTGGLGDGWKTSCRGDVFVPDELLPLILLFDENCTIKRFVDITPKIYSRVEVKSQRKHWLDNVTDDCYRRGWSIVEATHLATDRQRWRTYICPGIAMTTRRRRDTTT